MPTVRVLDIAFKVFMACMWLMLWGVSGLWFSIPTLAIFVIRGIVKSCEPNIPQLIQQYSADSHQDLDGIAFSFDFDLANRNLITEEEQASFDLAGTHMGYGVHNPIYGSHDLTENPTMLGVDKL